MGVQVADQACPAALQRLFLKAAKARRLPNFLPVGAALVEYQSMKQGRKTLLLLQAAPEKVVLFRPALVGAWILC